MIPNVFYTNSNQRDNPTESVDKSSHCTNSLSELTDFMKCDLKNISYLKDINIFEIAFFYKLV